MESMDLFLSVVGPISVLVQKFLDHRVGPSLAEELRGVLRRVLLLPDEFHDLSVPKDLERVGNGVLAQSMDSFVNIFYSLLNQLFLSVWTGCKLVEDIIKHFFDGVV